MRAATLTTLLVLLLAGCASTPPPAERAPTQNAAPSDNSTPTASQEALPTPTRADETADLRVRIVDHFANDTVTSATIDVFGKAPMDLTLHYAYIGMENGASAYFDVERIVPAGQERRIVMEDASGDPHTRTAPWTNMTLFYSVGKDEPGGRDGIAAFDLRGRGLP